MKRKALRLVKNVKVDRLPAGTAEEAADLFQWIFYLPWFAEKTTHLLQARPLANALTQLRYASCRKDGNAQDVLLCWRILCDVAGPWLTGQFIASEAWLAFCPDPKSDRDTGSMAVLWSGDGGAVVCRATFRQEVPVDLKFTIEKEMQ